MIPRLPIHKRLLLLGFYIAGTTAGVIFLTSINNGDKFFGGIAGFLCALFLSFIVFPELRNMLPKFWNGNNRYGFKFKDRILHPTQIPIMLGMLWFLALVLLSISNTTISFVNNHNNVDILLFPTLFLFGLSGLIIIKRNEVVGRYGELHRGFWATFSGILMVVFCWGGLIFMILANIFNW